MSVQVRVGSGVGNAEEDNFCAVDSRSRFLCVVLFTWGESV